MHFTLVGGVGKDWLIAECISGSKKSYKRWTELVEKEPLGLKYTCIIANPFPHNSSLDIDSLFSSGANKRMWFSGRVNKHLAANLENRDWCLISRFYKSVYVVATGPAATWKTGVHWIIVPDSYTMCLVIQWDVP